MKKYLTALCLLFSGIALSQTDTKFPPKTPIVKKEVTAVQQTQVLKMIDDISHKIKSGNADLKDYENRAMFYLVLQQHAEAILDYNYLILTDSSKASYFYFRGISHIATDNRISACEDLKRAKDLNYDFNGGELMMLCN